VRDLVDYEKLFLLAKPYLEKNDLGAAHKQSFSHRQKKLSDSKRTARLNRFRHNSA
jgi:hypothetical protein